MQAKFIADLKNFGGDNVGLLMKLIPKEIRQATSGIASAFANPIDQLVDKMQDGTNDLMRQLPQQKQASGEDVITFAQQSAGVSHKMKQRSAIKGSYLKQRLGN